MGGWSGGQGPEKSEKPMGKNGGGGGGYKKDMA